MKHRKIVGRLKKKNRIQEVNASNSDDANTSPLESPNVGEEEEAGAVQRFLASRRAQRMVDHGGDHNQRNGYDRNNYNDKNNRRKGSVGGVVGDGGDKERPSSQINDDDEPDNDSGDEGLAQRKNFLLAGGLPSKAGGLPSKASNVSNLTPTLLSPFATGTTFLPTVKSNEALTKTTTQNPTTVTYTTNNNNNNKAPHPLLTDRAVSSVGSTEASLSNSPHHRPRAPSVTFSTQTTDLESGRKAATTFTSASSASAVDNNGNSNDMENNAFDNFFSFLMPRNEAMLTTDDNDNAGAQHHQYHQTEHTPLLSQVREEEQTPTKPLLTSSRDGSILPGGVVDLSRATALGADDDDDDDLETGSFHSESDSTVGGKGTTTDDIGTSAGGQSILEQLFEEGTQAVYDTITEATTEAWEQYDENCHYDWREFWKGGGFLKFCRWLATGAAPENYKQSDDEVQENLNSLARMLSLLREYQERFGMPEVGGGKDQEYILREVTKDLYLGGSPIWALEPVMKRVAEGLTGKRGVDFFMLPRRAFIFAPSSGATAMFRITRGYDMQRLDDMETVAVRLASFASNTSSVASVPARWPKPQEMRRAFRTESLAGCYYSKEEMAEEILNLASDAEGLFFYIKNHQSKCYTNRESPLYVKGENSGKLSELGEFWTVEDDVRELFSRLAAIEAAYAIDKIDAERKPLYTPMNVLMFRVLASSCACAFWFNGSWIDIIVSGALGELVATIGSSPILSKQERIIFEALASLLVGFSAACISLTWPVHCCFGAMAISGVLDLLQGFRVVYSIIEIMSRHTVTGGADFLEGVFFTTLIAYCLKFGQFMALKALGEPETDEYLQCTKGVSQWWYLIFVPIGAVAWSGLFNPHYFDLPIMAAHGVLGYLVSWQFYKSASNTQMNNFLAAMAVTFSAGIVSRFTGRQALGNTVAGLYVLLPGAYLVTHVYSDRIDGFLWQIILRAIIIGIGGWTGTILCTPTLLGINKGLMEHSKAVPTLVENGSVSDNMSSSSSIASGQNFRRRDKNIRKNGTGALLFF